MPYRKNVFFVGAGTSVHVGAPVMAQFLAVSEEIVRSRQLPPQEASRFENVFRYRDSLEIVEEKVGISLTDLEDLFGLVDVDARVEPANIGIRRDLVFLLLRTLEMRVKEKPRQPITIHLDPGNVTRPPYEATVSEHFVDPVARRWHDPPSSRVCADSIVSLNYDLVLDRAIVRRGLRLDYCLGEVTCDWVPQNGIGLKLLKLHGSANWATCAHCPQTKVFQLEEHAVSTIESTRCECGLPLDPFIVPPTWSKGEYRAALMPVWKAAFQELLQAERLVLIGTSLPNTDRFLRYLFGLALARNTRLDRILVIDPKAEKVCEGLFERHKRRGHFQQQPEAFEKTVAEGTLQQFLGQTYPKYSFAW